MAIVPSRDNFEVGVRGFGVKLGNGPQWVDETVNLRNYADAAGAMANHFYKLREDNQQIEAADAANKYLERLNEIQIDHSNRKGLAAYKDDEGNLVENVIGQAQYDARSEATLNMSGPVLQKFNSLVAASERSFRSSTAKHTNDQYNSYQDDVIKESCRQYGEQAIMNAKDNPEYAQKSLQDFADAQYWNLRNRKGYDHETATSLANQATADVVESIINQAYDDGDRVTAEKYKESYKEILGERLFKIAKRQKSYDSIDEAESYVNRLVAPVTDNAIMKALIDGESSKTGGEDPNNPGKPLRSYRSFKSKKRPGVQIHAWGMYQLSEDNLESAARLAGEKPDLERLKNDVKYANKLGKYFTEQTMKDYAADADGDARVLFAYHQTRPDVVKTALKIQKETGVDFLVALDQSAAKNKFSKIDRDELINGVKRKEELRVKYERQGRVDEPNWGAIEKRIHDTYAHDDERRNSALRRLQVVKGEYVSTTKINEDKAMQSAVEFFREKKGTLNDFMKTKEWQDLTWKQQEAIKKEVSKTVKTDWTKVNEIIMQEGGFQNVNLDNYVGIIAEKDREDLKKMQARGESPKYVDFMQNLDKDLRAQLVKAGVNFQAVESKSGKKMKEKDIKRYMAASSFMVDEVRKYMRTHDNKMPDDNGMKEIVAKATRVASSGMISTKYRYELTAQDKADYLHDHIRDAVITEARKRYGNSMTEKQLLKKLAEDDPRAIDTMFEKQEKEDETLAQNKNNWFDRIKNGEFLKDFSIGG